MSLVSIMVSSYIAASLLCTIITYCACVLASRKQPKPPHTIVQQRTRFAACNRRATHRALSTSLSMRSGIKG